MTPKPNPFPAALTLTVVIIGFIICAGWQYQPRLHRVVNGPLIAVPYAPKKDQSRHPGLAELPHEVTE